MGKQARGKAKCRSQQITLPRPSRTDWRGKLKPDVARTERELESLWLTRDLDADLPATAPAMPLTGDDWPRSCSGEPELDSLLERLWR